MSGLFALEPLWFKRTGMSSGRDFDLEDLTKWGNEFVSISAEKQLRLAGYLELLLLWNRKTNLVSQLSRAEILCKHFADSLVPASVCVPGERIVDIGSGAGFPSLVIAIVRQDVNVTLIEATAKKASFMVDVISRLKIANARVMEGRVEEVWQRSEHRLKYSLAVSRAFAATPKILALARPLLALGGRVVVMKGPAESHSEEHAGYRLADRRQYELPDGSRRVLLVFEA